VSVRPFSPYLLNQLSYNFKRKNRFLDRPLRSEKRLFLFFALSIHWSDVTVSKELTAKRKLWEKTYFAMCNFGLFLTYCITYFCPLSCYLVTFWTIMSMFYSLLSCQVGWRSQSFKRSTVDILHDRLVTFIFYCKTRKTAISVQQQPLTFLCKIWHDDTERVSEVYGC